jgi:hypothetical protein
MKVRIAMLTAYILLTACSAQAQKMQRRAPSEEVKVAMAQITTPLKLDASQISRTDSAFADFYKDQNKIFEEARLAGTRPGRASFQKILDERDAKLKLIFTPDQYTHFKNEVEDKLRPQFQSHEDN